MAIADLVWRYLWLLPHLNRKLLIVKLANSKTFHGMKNRAMVVARITMGIPHYQQNRVRMLSTEQKHKQK